MSAACLYDNGRDDFLATATSKPPSKFDSIESLPYDVHQITTLAFNASRWSSKTRPSSDGQRNDRNTSSSSSSSSSHATTVAGWSGGNKSCCTSSELTDTGSWRAEVSGRLSTAPSSRSAVGVTSPCKTPSGAPKKFFWGPKVVCPRQEVDRHIRRTNVGEPATFAMAVNECPSTVSTIRSVVPRTFVTSLNEDDSTIGSSMSAFVGMEPYIRTSITDRAHDGIYDTDTAHKSTLAGRLKGRDLRSPHISRDGKRFANVAGTGRENTEPGHYDIASGIEATSTSSTCLSFPQQKCNYDSYIRRGLGQTTAPSVGPGKYGQEPATALAKGASKFPTVERWPEQLSASRKASSNRGPWDDVKSAWGRGGYIEPAIARRCDSYLPGEIQCYKYDLDIDHLGKETLDTAMRRNPKRYAASFSNTEERDWRIVGDPVRGPGTYAVEDAERLTFPAPLGGAGDADPARPSVAFRIRRTPFDTRFLADGYKTLRPRFSTPRSALYASELHGPPREASAVSDTGTVADKAPAVPPLHARVDGGKRRSPAAKAAAINAAAAADPRGIGGRDSRSVRLERPSVLDPVRDGSRRRAAAVIWSSLHKKERARKGYHSGLVSVDAKRRRPRVISFASCGVKLGTCVLERGLE